MEIASVPISSCSKEHQKIYQQWFRFADSYSDGRITGNDAIKFFSMSNLNRQDLKQVWAIADSKRQGYLGISEFVAAMQLVSLAQAGHEITHDLLSRNVDLENVEPPVMEGLDALMAAKKKHSHKTNENEVNGAAVVQQSPSALWFSSKSAKKVPLSAVTSIIDGLKRLYVQKLKPLEVAYRFNDFRNRLPIMLSGQSPLDSHPLHQLKILAPSLHCPHGTFSGTFP